MYFTSHTDYFCSFSSWFFLSTATGFTLNVLLLTKYCLFVNLLVNAIPPLESGPSAVFLFGDLLDSRLSPVCSSNAHPCVRMRSCFRYDIDSCPDVDSRTLRPHFVRLYRRHPQTPKVSVLLTLKRLLDTDFTNCILFSCSHILFKYFCHNTPHIGANVTVAFKSFGRACSK